MNPILRSYIEGYLQSAEEQAAETHSRSAAFCEGQATALRDVLRYLDEVLS